MPLLMTLLLFLPHGTHSHLLTLHSVNLVPPTTFALILANANFGTKAIHTVITHKIFDQFTFCFYPFLLGSPIDVGVSYDASLSKTDNAVLLRAQRIAKLPLPYVVSYRLFTSLVSFCYNHYALSCDLSSCQNASLQHAITSILVPKRSKWVRREALFSLVTPGHLLSPHLFLNYQHVIEYLLYVRQTNAQQRTQLSQLWYDTLHLK